MATDQEGTDGPVELASGEPAEHDAAQPQPVPRASVDKGSAQTGKHAEDEEEEEEEEEEEADMSFLRNRSRGGMLLLVSDKEKQGNEPAQSQAIKPEAAVQKESAECQKEEVVTVGIQLTQSPVEVKAEMSDMSAKDKEAESEQQDKSTTEGPSAVASPLTEQLPSAEGAQQGPSATMKPESDHVIATDESEAARKQANGPVESETPSAPVDLSAAKEMEDGTLSSRVVREHKTTTVKIEAAGQGLEEAARDMAEKVLKQLEDNMSNLQTSGLPQGLSIQRTTETAFSGENKVPVSQLSNETPDSAAVHEQKTQTSETTVRQATVVSSGSEEKTKSAEPDSWVVPIPIKVEVPFPETSQPLTAQADQTTMQSMSSTVTTVTSSSGKGPPKTESEGHVIPITVKFEAPSTQAPGEGATLSHFTATTMPGVMQSSQTTKQTISSHTTMVSSSGDEKRVAGQEIPIPIKVENASAKEPQATPPLVQQTPQPASTVMPTSVQVTVQPGQTTKQTISRTETKKTYITNKQESSSNWIQQESVSKNNWISGAPWSRAPRSVQPSGAVPSAKHFFQETKTTRTEQFRSDGRSAPQHTVTERKEVYTDGDQRLRKMIDQTKETVTQPQEQTSSVKQQWSTQSKVEGQNVGGGEPFLAANPANTAQQPPSTVRTQTSTVRQQWTSQGNSPAAPPDAMVGGPFNATPSFAGPGFSKTNTFTQEITTTPGAPVQTESSYSKQQWSRQTRKETAYPAGAAAAPQAPFQTATTPENAANDFQRYFETMQQNAPPGSQFRSETKFSKQQWTTQGSSPMSPQAAPGTGGVYRQQAMPQQQTTVQFTEQSGDGNAYNVQKEIRKTYVQSEGQSPIYGQTPGGNTTVPSSAEQFFHSTAAQTPMGPFGRMPITRTVTSSWTSRFNRETSGGLPEKE
ncbi:hypothetical protein TTRE_0000114501 [Trichuris trichiura]|uniref:Uncharacterized protein n=1 Tax=Trichuris trichiura TaxID=36087 RepID=A0A077YZI4_TRITR|nr:hypothetical protein TTRE_0000114501 [Trichuris trichiura]